MEQAESRPVIQRVKALNMFIHDIYHRQNIVKAGIVSAALSEPVRVTPPADLIASGAAEPSSRQTLAQQSVPQTPQ